MGAVTIRMKLKFFEPTAGHIEAMEIPYAAEPAAVKLNGCIADAASGPNLVSSVTTTWQCGYALEENDALKLVHTLNVGFFLPRSGYYLTYLIRRVESS